jgi:23S rRNA (pseudouridine1915-N3)-methyltransferase
VKFRIVAVGKAPAGPLGDAIRAFEQRAARYWPLEVHEVRTDASRSRTADEVRRIDAERLLARARGWLVALDERGRPFDSNAFAAWMRDRRELAEDVSFLIGGANGLHETVRSQAHLLLAVAPWTLPHDLARLVLAEQLYRAGTLLRGEPYHRP